MIQIDLHQQTATCTFCDEVKEIPRRLLRDQDGVLQLREELEADHRECRQYAGNPKLASLSREFRKRLQRETKKAAQATRFARAA